MPEHWIGLNTQLTPSRTRTAEVQAGSTVPVVFLRRLTSEFSVKPESVPLFCQFSDT